jgi:DNA-binding MarR family transcriptional regulator
MLNHQPGAFDKNYFRGKIFPNWKYMRTIKKDTAATSRETLAQMRAMWEEMVLLQPRMRAALPADLQRAKKQLNAQSEGAHGFADMQLFGFYRLGSVLGANGAALTMGELSEALCVPLSSATRLVDGLVASGYAVRLSDPTDRRIVRVALSPQGEKLYASFTQFFDRRLEEFLSHFDEAERTQIVHLMRKSLEILKAMRI